MKRIQFTSIMAVLLVLFALLNVGCSSGENAGTVIEPELKRATQPDDVVFAVNGMNVTKAEFDEWCDIMNPDMKFGIFKAVQGYFLPHIILEQNFSNETKKIVEEMDGILEKVKSGEMTFDEAIVEYSDDQISQDGAGMMESYGTGNLFYTLDRELLKMDEGQISDPIVTPIGVMAIKLDKISRDIDGEFVSADFHQIILTLDKFFPDADNQAMMKLQELQSKAEIEIKDVSLLKLVPEITMQSNPPEDPEAYMKEIEEMPDPEKNWDEQPDDTVVMVLSGKEITAGELKEVVEHSMPSKRDIYNFVIYRRFVPSLSTIGYFKNYHERIAKDLLDIKAKIEKGEMSFEAAQEEYSTDPGSKDNPVYENIGRQQFVPEFEGIMFTIELNVISEPFFTEYGGHILMVESETLDENGERETVNVRHILLGYENYLENKDDPNAMYQERMKINEEMEIKVYDTYLQSVLPQLGHENDEDEPEESEEIQEVVEEETGTDVDSEDVEESEEIQEDK